MSRVVLANVDYQRHTSTEGNELQEGLREAGWILCGKGYDGLQNIDEILARYQPEAIFVQDCRDWMPESNISFRKDLGFYGLELIGRQDIPAFTIIKDAWGWPDIQSRTVDLIKARGVACYYRAEMVHAVARYGGRRWLGDIPLVRIHHSVDARAIEPLYKNTARRPALVSGFRQPCYPIRETAFHNANLLGLETLRHPGYGNFGADTPNYLKQISEFKVHLATASTWGCAFRKIIESVACGLTPITNLPESDVLPEIDGALVRIPQVSIGEIHEDERGYLSFLRDTIQKAVAAWDAEERQHWAEKALAYFDWRVSGERLSRLLMSHVQRPAIA